jgi:Heterokaryon incompatibility protein (HET)
MDSIRFDSSNKLSHFAKATVPPGKVCGRCSQIDFDNIYSTDLNEASYSTKMKAWLVHDIGPLPADTEQVECDLCRLFAQVRVLSTTSEGDQRYSISIASSVYKNSDIRQSCDLFDTPILIVHPTGIHQSQGEVSKFQFIYPTSLPDNSTIAILGREISPELDYDILKGWISECYDNHQGTCQLSSEQSVRLVGFKLIDCLSGNIISASGNEPFVALSYVWGVSSKLSILSDEKIPDATPAVIKDAMLVVRNLGYRYLWVDRYCIPQNDTIVKHLQIRRMDVIYQQAELTIICATGTTASDGIAGVSRPRAAQPKARIGKYTLVSSLPSPRFEVNQSRWATRAWTYQEGLLSRRRLIFTESQALFQCQGGYHPFESVQEPADVLHRPQLLEYQSNRLNHALPLTFGVSATDLQDRINEYAGRELSHQSDGLYAIAGILNAFKSRELIDGHVWGIPILKNLSYHRAVGKAYRRMPFGDRLAHGLCWSLEVRKDGEKMRSHVRRREGFPSWSWVGWIGSRRWVFLEPIQNGLGWPENQPHVEPSRYPVSFTIQKSDGTKIPIGSLDIDAPSDLDMETLPFLFVEAWFFNLTFTDKCLPMNFAAQLNQQRQAGDNPELWIGGVKWNQEYDDDPEIHRHILASQYTALLIGFGVTHTRLNLLIVQDHGDYFERAGILPLEGVKPKRIWGQVSLEGIHLDKQIFRLG